MGRSSAPYAVYDGVIERGFQFASGSAVGRNIRPSPFSAGTLALQEPHFRALGFDMEAAIPNLFRGTINIRVDRNLSLERPDVTLNLVDWTAAESAPGARIPPETFSLTRCCLAYDGAYHAGYLYYPHPETKPPTNEHRYDVLEILTHRIEGIAYDRPASVICRGDVFASP